MKSFLKIAWTCIPFALAAASDCGVSWIVIAAIGLSWIFVSIGFLERMRRKEEQINQRRLSECRERLARK